jgi:hypothetical protein
MDCFTNRADPVTQETDYAEIAGNLTSVSEHKLL